MNANDAPSLDKSPRVSQRGIYSGSLKIREFNWTTKQSAFIEQNLDKNNCISFCKAPAGTGKTLASTYSMLQLLKRGAVKELVYIRLPLESSSKSVGFLPGDFNEKIGVYGAPLYDNLKQLLSESEILALEKDKRITVDSIGFVKGRTYNNSAIIVDEAEDLTIQELSLIMTRLGKFSKLFIIGDINQTNIKNSGFEKVFKAFNNLESRENGITTFEFDSSDCMRSPITRFIVERFEDINS